MLGFSYDWDRELATTDIEYFRWTQWIFLQIYDSGTTQFTFTDGSNLEFDSTALREGGIWQGWNESTFSSGGGIQPENGFYQGYNDNVGTGKSFRVLYLQSNPNHNSSATSNSFFGGFFETKEQGADTGRTSGTMAGGAFYYLGQNTGGDSTLSTAIGGIFSSSFAQAGQQTVGDFIGGQFTADPTGGTNKDITNVKVIETRSPSASIDATSSVVDYAAVYLNNVRCDLTQPSSDCDAIRIQSQTADGSTSQDGNLTFYGGAWKTGHIVLGGPTGAHIWSNGSTIYGKHGAPTGATDGTDLLASGSGDITDVYDCASGDCSEITATDGDHLDFSSVNPNSAGEGITLPQTTTCGGSGLSTGAICYGTTNDEICVWDGSAWDCSTLGASGSTVNSMMGFSGAAITVAKGVTTYLGVTGLSQSTTEANQEYYVTQAGTVQNLYCYVSANTTGAAGNTITLRKNGVSQSTLCTYNSGVTGSQSDTSNTFTVAAGDRVAIEVVNQGSGGGAKDLTVESVSFELAP
jgi:hypothetical protein